MTTLRAPFVWFGGKSKAASVIWRAFGPDVANYVEPFFGSGAVLFARPGGAGKIETVNDLDCDVANFFRATKHEPDAVAEAADEPINEADLRARGRSFLATLPAHRERMMSDPEFFDAVRAGLWVWAVSTSIGKSWAQGMPSVGHSGRGVHRLSFRGYEPTKNGEAVLFTSVREWMRAIAARLRYTRVLCGDWKRVLGPTTAGFSPSAAAMGMSPTAILFDAPYDEKERTAGIYREETVGVAREVFEWAVAHGDDPRLRLCVCGYAGEHEFPSTWREHAWKAKGGYANANGENLNATRERCWFSPHCLPIEEQRNLFGGGGLDHAAENARREPPVEFD